jgi:predicted transcriptional regulator
LNNRSLSSRSTELENYYFAVASQPNFSDDVHHICNARGSPMKTATMPALRVEPELRQAAEEILRPGETLSAFVEDSLRRNVEFRRSQEAFITRGLASLMAAEQSGEYIPAKKVLSKLSAKLEKTRSKESAK